MTVCGESPQVSQPSRRGNSPHLWISHILGHIAPPSPTPHLHPCSRQATGRMVFLDTHPTPARTLTGAGWPRAMLGLGFLLLLEDCSKRGSEGFQPNIPSLSNPFSGVFSGIPCPSHPESLTKTLHAERKERFEGIGSWAESAVGLPTPPPPQPAPVFLSLLPSSPPLFPAPLPPLPHLDMNYTPTGCHPGPSPKHSEKHTGM